MKQGTIKSLRQRVADGKHLIVLIDEKVVIHDSPGVISSSVSFHSESPEGISPVDSLDNDPLTWDFFKRISEIGGRSVVLCNSESGEEIDFVNSPAYKHRFGNK